MTEFDAELTKKFRREIRTTNRGTLHDPQYPYSVTVEPSKDGHMIRVHDTRKRWWGREVVRHKHDSSEESTIIMSGPSEMALLILQMVIERKLPLG